MLANLVGTPEQDFRVSNSFIRGKEGAAIPPRQIVPENVRTLPPPKFGRGFFDLREVIVLPTVLPLRPVRLYPIELGWMSVKVALSIDSRHANRFSHD